MDMKAALSTLVIPVVAVLMALVTTACEPAAEEEAGKTKASSTSRPKPVEQSETAQFLACVRSKGTEPERNAVSNVVKVTGADKMRGYLDMPKIFTSYSGGMLRHSGEGVLLASAFATCYTSENGLVTVYDRDGHVLGNGQF